MCINPLLIRNRREKLDERFHSLYNCVPCGKCWQCREMKSQSYNVRAMAHYVDTILRGGAAYYYTLTYNNEHLPRCFATPCFSKRDIQLFFKRLRKAINGEFSISYFLTSEYGGNTHRPHYHFILYTNKKVSPQKIHYYIENCWQNGFIKAGDNNGLVSSVDCIQYCAKYICKEDDFKQSFPQNCSVSLRRLFEPFHLESKGFGIAIKDMIDFNSLFTGKFVLSTSKGVKSYAIPLYILRKCCYEVRKNSKGNVCYRLNDLGRELKLKSFDSLIQRKVQSYQELLSINIETLVNVDDWFAKYPRPEIDPLTLALYDTCFRGKFIHTMTGDPLCDYMDKFSPSESTMILPLDFYDLANFDFNLECQLAYITHIKRVKTYLIYVRRCQDFNAQQRILQQLNKKFKKQKIIKPFNLFFHETD